MLRPDDLVGLDDFTLGNLTVSPSRRSVASGDRSLALEPRVMQVLVLLARSAGEVVTRQHLFDEVWGGVPVGEDSLNRAIAGARRALALDREGLALETIPRTGYRLDVAGLGRSPGPSLDRRAVIGGAIGAAALAAGGLGLWNRRRKEQRAFDQLMERGGEALAQSDDLDQAVKLLRRAAEIRPGSAEALGMLAYAQMVRSDRIIRAQPANATREASKASRAALAIDPAEPNARLADILIRRSMLDFAATEDRLRSVLASAPGNQFAMRQLWNMLQCVGRSREALALVERAIAVDPLAAGNQFPRAQLLWIVGRNAEADRVIDRAIQDSPDHRFVRFARFTILAFTGRSRAALAMLDSPATSPQNFSPEGVALWRTNLAAFERRDPAAIAAARSASLEGAKQNLQLASQAVLALSELGEIDAAFEVANALFAVGSERSPVRSTSWRFAPWLFTPPLAPLRADPRFGAVCDAAGLTDYWAKRGVEPDYRRSA